MSTETGLGNDDLRVTESDDGLVLRATIDRAEKRNALNDAVLEGLGDVLDDADDGSARVVVPGGPAGTSVPATTSDRWPRASARGHRRSARGSGPSRG